jgi:hypothetical protein
MSKKITDIEFWGILLDYFPEDKEIIFQMDESKITNDQWWTIARDWRNRLLIESDWSQLSDSPLSEIQRESWKQYRQELRDITNNVINPKSIVFPDIPS